MPFEMNYGNDYRYLPVTSVRNGNAEEVLPDLSYLTVQIVNVCFVGFPEKGEWVLVDTGMPGSADLIIKEAENRFGSHTRPKGIVLTHGHFDHVGAVIEIIEHWNVPVYAHEMEMPFLTGRQGYPPPDPSVEGGLVAKMSFVFPNQPIQLGAAVKALPPDGTIPVLPEWRWILTDGHTPGHISLFRDKDRTLLAGDAFVTVRQDSLYQVFAQEREISGPPRYFTTDWPAARRSVEALADLKPAVAITGHGLPMSGKELTDHLRTLVEQFDRIAIPDHGKYVQ
ncbi:MBL fold metallo-hydrolase [Cohnella sp. CFH 77786]|uniref:MBL fold metallo-hydrolase n=1 Tax=Cohnella sp. CFH 77786 TaxID=2662265 RepID=UPI001C60A1EC|nr:MBL fold metallo-hydrolase [Cohnella sp. CFH 77786]MBW5446452.1 MBL fold metallo-hydrolase [Cohnella sp. CFH 77786]